MNGADMAVVETGRVAGGLNTVAVFKDVEAAKAAVDVLRAKGFAAESLSVVAKAGEAVATWAASVLVRPLQALTLPRLEAVVAAGPLVDAIDGGTGHLAKAGLAEAMKRAGFQAHDGLIFEKLVERGGVLVAVRNEPRAADAISVFHNCGGGNAAIGAWAGRV